MPKPPLLFNPLFMHIDQEKAPDLMAALWRLKLDGITAYEAQSAAMMTLAQLVETYLSAGGDALKIVHIFQIKSNSLAEAIRDINGCMVHWQGYANIMEENQERSAAQKQAIQSVADVFGILNRGLINQSKQQSSN
ncbi:MAG: hypothetical protein OSB62_02835 [Alphaproteobacteria bacterium]|nr:hypothetical protein [Alphaproteobacteria bacterium]